MRDETMPTQGWEFNKDVADVFPDMLQRSIPNYSWMRESTSRIINSAVGDRPLDILDLGCSDGQEYEKLINDGIPVSNYIGIDVSVPMIEKAQEKYKDDSVPSWTHWDFRNYLPSFSGKFDVILSILTMQFIPVEYRSKLLCDINANMQSNGVFIYIEKTLGDSSIGQQTNVNAYHKMKSDNGYSAEAIEAKRMSLENVMQPMSARENEQMLKDAGFVVQRYWQAFNFVGWAAYKNSPSI
jgi:tRNA (cmo5U34)-methyltransferase